MPEDIAILYEEGPCMVASKPPGILTQSPPGIDSLEVRIKALLAQRQDRPERVYLGVPHRIDRPASGAILLGKTRRTTRRLAEQFEARAVKKIYWVCLEGQVTPACGTWKDFVRKVPDEARAEVVQADHADARQAVLHYRTLGTGPWGSWLEVELDTGRTHQIRIQAASRGHPVLGDGTYGSTIPFGTQYDDVRLRSIALHSRELTFRHPTLRESVTVTAPLPADWATLGVQSVD